MRQVVNVLQQQQQRLCPGAPAHPKLCLSSHRLPHRSHRYDHVSLHAQHHRQQTPAAVAAAAAAAAVQRTGSSEASLLPSTSSEANDWRQLLISKAVDPGQLVKLTLKARIKGEEAAASVNVRGGAGGAQTSSSSPPSAAAGTDAGGKQQPAVGFGSSSVPKGSMPYKQLLMRPVMIKNKCMLQASLFTARQDITKNFTDSQAAQELQQLLQLPWQSVHLVTATESMTVQLSKKGKALVKVSPNSSSINDNSNSNTLKTQAPQQQQQQQQQQHNGEVTELFSSSSSSQPESQQQQQQVLISLQHDRVKATPIRGDVPDPFLQQIGLQTAEGRIKANMQAKFTQINEFLKLLSHSGELERWKATTTGNNTTTSSSSSSSSSSSQNGGGGDDTSDSDSSSSSSRHSAVHILDAGCGSSHLTFGTFHYLHTVLGLPVRLTGVDTNKALMERSNRACTELGISGVAQFHTAAIKDFPSLKLPSPDIVLALHACDTATDEALAVGVLTGARVIMSVPCCQKDIQRQFQRQQQQQQQQGTEDDSSSSSSRSSSMEGVVQVQQVFEPLLAHGILRQRQLDLLTDTFRAQLLRLAGYRTDVVEFVSTEHTPRNLLIRAVKQRRSLSAGEADALVLQYRQLRDAWGVRPHLERLLRDSLPTDVVQALL